MPKDKGKAPVSQSTANKTAPVHVVNPLYLAHRKDHNPVWDDGESRDLVNQNILGFWISTPFPAQLWVRWRTSLPACKAVTKGILTWFCHWLGIYLAEQKLFLSLIITHASCGLRKLIFKEGSLLPVWSTELFSNLSCFVQTEGWVYSLLSEKMRADITRTRLGVYFRKNRCYVIRFISIIETCSLW